MDCRRYQRDTIAKTDFNSHVFAESQCPHLSTERYTLKFKVANHDHLNIISKDPVNRMATSLTCLDFIELNLVHLYPIFLKHYLKRPHQNSLPPKPIASFHFTSPHLIPIKHITNPIQSLLPTPPNPINNDLHPNINHLLFLYLHRWHFTQLMNTYTS